MNVETPNLMPLHRITLIRQIHLSKRILDTSYNILDYNTDNRIIATLLSKP